MIHPEIPMIADKRIEEAVIGCLILEEDVKERWFMAEQVSADCFTDPLCLGLYRCLHSELEFREWFEMAEYSPILRPLYQPGYVAHGLQMSIALLLCDRDGHSRFIFAKWPEYVEQLRRLRDARVAFTAHAEEANELYRRHIAGEL